MLGDRAIKEVTKVKEVRWLGPNPADWCPYQKRLGHRHTLRADHLKTQEKLSTFMPRRGASEETNPVDILTWDL